MARPDFLKSSDWEVELDVFQGPLDLLLHLIRTLEIDIYDIPIVEVTEQYLSYIHTMQVLQLDVASDYLVMAATLLQIKSEMLVPRNEEHLTSEADDYDDTDPREELIQMLLEYKKYQDVLPKLESKEQKRRQFHSKTPSDISEFQERIPLATGEVDLTHLLDAMNHVLHERELLDVQPTTIEANEVTVFDRIEWIEESISRSSKKRVNFSELIQTPTKQHVVVTFLALLELMKKNQVRVVQEHLEEEIEVEWINDEEDE